MAEPLANRREVDACLEQVNRGRVSKRVGMDAFPRDGGDFRAHRGQMLAQQVPHPEAGQFGAAAIDEQWRCRPVGVGSLRLELPQQLRGLRLDGADPDLVAFALQFDLARRLQAQVAQA